MRLSRRIFAGALCGAIALPAVALEQTAHDFSFTSIEGEPLSMAGYAGKTVLVVNTASRCGFTSQYKDLQALYERYRDDGLVVLGVPSNDFRQELSSSAEVKEFCEMTYGIDFPMTEIESVKGAGAHPLFGWMAAQGSTPNWNFNKFLIGADGKLIAQYGSTTRPNSEKLVARVEDAIKR